MTDPISNERLLPCPFCGSADIYTEGPCYTEFMCNGCGLSQNDHEQTRDQAIAAWNRRQSPAGVEPGAWTMRINYGPEGEANYANVYSGTGEFVGNLKVHHAGAIVDAFASPAPKAVTITDEMVERAAARFVEIEKDETEYSLQEGIRELLTAALSSREWNDGSHSDL